MEGQSPADPEGAGLRPIEDKAALPPSSPAEGVIAKCTRLLLGYSWIPIIILAPVFATSLSTNASQSSRRALAGFAFLFTFRYLRFVANFIGVWRHRSIPVDPTCSDLGPDNVTVVIPTVAPDGPDFRPMMVDIVASRVKKIIVSVVTDEQVDKANKLKNDLKHEGDVEIIVAKAKEGGKRWQLKHALKLAHTKFVIFADDHVRWSNPAQIDEPDIGVIKTRLGSGDGKDSGRVKGLTGGEPDRLGSPQSQSGPENFVRAVIAPFRDDHTGGVCMEKQVTRIRYKSWIDDFCNFTGLTYLERFNDELKGSNGLDGAVYVISGRTAAYRTDIIRSHECLEGLTDEQWDFWWFGQSTGGALRPDDDNYFTRFLDTHRWKIQYQDSPDAVMYTTLGIDGWGKLMQQMFRWARTTFRSHRTALFRERVVWLRYPWSVYSIYIARLTGFALVIDPALLLLARAAGFSKLGLALLCGWILCSKMVKPWAHFRRRHPRDLWYFVPYVLFGYFHSLIKLYAMITMTNNNWGSRPGVDQVKVKSP